jgi:hypothetical protein
MLPMGTSPPNDSHQSLNVDPIAASAATATAAITFVALGESPLPTLFEEILGRHVIRHIQIPFAERHRMLYQMLDELTAQGCYAILFKVRETLRRGHTR